MLKRAGLVAFFPILLLLYGCLGQSEADVLSPGEVDRSMLDKVVEVKGKITLLVENPGGLGGLYLKLSDSDGHVDVRVQEDIWQTLDESKKAQFKKGRTITAKGVLFQAGRELVIIYNKYTVSSNTTSTKP